MNSVLEMIHEPTAAEIAAAQSIADSLKLMIETSWRWDFDLRPLFLAPAIVTSRNGLRARDFEECRR